MNSGDLSKTTQQLFTASSERQLNQEETRECISNMVGFLRLLAEWEATAAGNTLSSNKRIPSPNELPGNPRSRK